MMHVRTVRVRAIALNTVVVSVTAAVATVNIHRLLQLQPENKFSALECMVLQI